MSPPAVYDFFINIEEEVLKEIPQNPSSDDEKTLQFFITRISPGVKFCGSLTVAKAVEEIPSTEHLKRDHVSYLPPISSLENETRFGSHYVDIVSNELRSNKIIDVDIILSFALIHS